MEDDDDFGRLTTWLAGLRADRHRLGRQREHWLRQQLAEESSLADSLLDLVGSGADRGTNPTVLMTRSRPIMGVVLAVGRDVVVIAEGSTRRPTAVVLDSIEVVHRRGSDQRPDAHPGGGGPWARGPSAPETPVSLEELVLDALNERTPVTITTLGGSSVTGIVASIGTDIITVVEGTDPSLRLTVPVRSVNDIRL